MFFLGREFLYVALYLVESANLDQRNIRFASTLCFTRLCGLSLFEFPATVILAVHAVN